MHTHLHGELSPGSPRFFFYSQELLQQIANNPINEYKSSNGPLAATMLHFSTNALRRSIGP